MRRQRYEYKNVAIHEGHFASDHVRMPVSILSEKISISSFTGHGKGKRLRMMVDVNANLKIQALRGLCVAIAIVMFVLLSHDLPPQERRE